MYVVMLFIVASVAIVMYVTGYSVAKNNHDSYSLSYLTDREKALICDHLTWAADEARVNEDALTQAGFRGTDQGEELMTIVGKIKGD